MRKSRYLHFRLHDALCALRSTLEALQAQRDLMQLRAWAKRKRLKGLYEHYQGLLVQQEMRLLRYRCRYSLVYELALWVRDLCQMLRPEPKYYPKGWAAKYRVSLERTT